MADLFLTHPRTLFHGKTIYRRGEPVTVADELAQQLLITGRFQLLRPLPAHDAAPAKSVRVIRKVGKPVVAASPAAGAPAGDDTAGAVTV